MLNVEVRANNRAIETGLVNIRQVVDTIVGNTKEKADLRKKTDHLISVHQDSTDKIDVLNPVNCGLYCINRMEADNRYQQKLVEPDTAINLRPRFFKIGDDDVPLPAHKATQYSAQEACQILDKCKSANRYIRAFLARDPPLIPIGRTAMQTLLKEYKAGQPVQWKKRGVPPSWIPMNSVQKWTSTIKMRGML